MQSQHSFVGYCDFLFLQYSSQFPAHLISIIGPTAKLHFTPLVVEREPSNIYLASGLEYSGRDIETGSVAPDHDVRRIGAVESLVRTAKVFGSWISKSQCPPIYKLAPPRRATARKGK